MKVNEFQKYPTNKERFDINWLKAMAYCNTHNCKNNWACYRYVERTSKNNVTYVPKPDNYDNCEFYSPAKCPFCNGKGWYKDWDKMLKKVVHTNCLKCSGTGELDFRR